jgi:hypothetical protein
MCRVALENDLAIMRALQVLLLLCPNPVAQDLQGRIDATEATLAAWAVGEDTQPVCDPHSRSHTA